MSWKLSALPSARPPDTTRRARLQVRAIAPGRGDLDEARVRHGGGCASAVLRPARRLSPAPAARERRGAHRGDDRAVALDLHRDDGIAGIDRPAEAVRGPSTAMTSLTCAHVQQRGDARHQVLAEGGRRTEHVAVVSARWLPRRPAPARRPADARSRAHRPRARARRPRAARPRPPRRRLRGRTPAR